MIFPETIQHVTLVDHCNEFLDRALGYAALSRDYFLLTEMG
jgi:hypothetical protein